ncbi:MAG: hypothetical protein AB1714_00610 [Acidobacteriota bacterium]
MTKTIKAENLRRRILTTLFVVITVACCVLLFTWILDIALPFQQEPVLILFGYLLLGLSYWRRETTPHRLAMQYLAFLERNGLHPQRRSPVMLLLKGARRWLSLSGDPRYDLLKGLAIEEVSRYSPIVAEPRSYALVSIATFLRDAPALRARACQEAAADHQTLPVVHAYLEFREDLAVRGTLGTDGFVSLDYLLRNAKARVEKRRRELGPGFEKELQAIREKLEAGEWPTSLPLVLRQTYNPRSPRRFAISLKELLDNRPWLRTALQDLFASLPSAVIERYLASRHHEAYLLTFSNPERGSVAQRLNALSEPLNWARLQSEGVSTTYSYRQYTQNARIGLVPREQVAPAGATQEDTFEAFARTLQDDLQKIFRVPSVQLEGVDPGDTQGAEILLHRLGLSGRDYYYLDVPEVTERQAIVKLQSLLAHGLETPDLLSVLEYAKDPSVLLNELLRIPFVDLAGLTDDEQKHLRGISVQFQKALMEAMNGNTMTDLLDRLRRGVKAEDVNRVVNALLPIVPDGMVPPMTVDRLRELTTHYLDTVRDVSALLQSQ